MKTKRAEIDLDSLGRDELERKAFQWQRRMLAAEAKLGIAIKLYARAFGISIVEATENVRDAYHID